jgi:hypothetical protein
VGSDLVERWGLPEEFAELRPRKSRSEARSFLVFGLYVFKTASKMDSGLECEGYFEGTMDVMALRKERHGVRQWRPWCCI